MRIKQPTEDQIRARAYGICRARGGEPGHEMDDWLQAEYELTQLPIPKVAELALAKSPQGKQRKSALASVAQVAMLAMAGGLARFNG